MSRRQERVAHELRNRIARVIKQRVGDPRLRDVTITGVKTSSDLSFVRVFYRTLGAREEVVQAFAGAKPFIRRCLAEGLRLRRVPELDFRLDESLDKAARIDEILREIHEGRVADSGEAAEPGRNKEEPT